jgi:hypothetical protein
LNRDIDENILGQNHWGNFTDKNQGLLSGAAGFLFTLLTLEKKLSKVKYGEEKNKVVEKFRDIIKKIHEEINKTTKFIVKNCTFKETVIACSQNESQETKVT